MPPALSRWSIGSSTTPRSSPLRASPTGSRKPANVPTSAPDSAAEPSREQAAVKSRTATADDIPIPTTILWFDQDGHPVVPTCTCPGRRAQRPSRMPAGHRRRRREASLMAASTTASSPQKGDDASDDAVHRSFTAQHHAAARPVSQRQQLYLQASAIKTRVFTAANTWLASRRHTMRWVRQQPCLRRGPPLKRLRALL